MTSERARKNEQDQIFEKNTCQIEREQENEKNIQESESERDFIKSVTLIFFYIIFN